jgi:hypothetical protein
MLPASGFQPILIYFQSNFNFSFLIFNLYFSFMIRNHWFFLIFVYLTISCSPGISLDLDKEQWKNDHNGCIGYRMKVYKEILKNKEKLLGLSNKKIVQILGNPNINELYSRNQKFFIYQVSPDQSCEGMEENTSGIFLIFRFNATGLVNEMYINDNASPTL